MEGERERWRDEKIERNDEGTEGVGIVYKQTGAKDVGNEDRKEEWSKL